MNTHIRRAGAALAISLLALTACGPKKAEILEGSDTTTATQEEKKQPKNPKFGQSAAWPDGVKVTVVNAGVFTPADTAVKGSEGTHTLFEVTIENGSKENFNPNSLSISASSGSKEAESIFDTANGLDGEPTTDVLPGKSISFKVGFTLADPNDITLQVKPLSFKKDKITFTS